MSGRSTTDHRGTGRWLLAPAGRTTGWIAACPSDSAASPLATGSEGRVDVVHEDGTVTRGAQLLALVGGAGDVRVALLPSGATARVDPSGADGALDAGVEVEIEPELLDAVGLPSAAATNRPQEYPYGPPAQLRMGRVAAGGVLPVGALEPNLVYLWVIDEAGGFRYAPKRQAGIGLYGHVCRHAHLVPALEGGRASGVARAGGELTAERLAGSEQLRWVLSNNSAYTFQRTDGVRLGSAELLAVLRLLERGGTDTSAIVLRDVVG